MTNILKASFNVEDIKGKMKVHKAVHGSPLSMKDVMDDQVLVVNDILIYEDEVDQYGSVATAQITVLFTESGESYASVSSTVSKSANGLIDFLEEMESIEVKVVTRQSKQGRDFLNLDIVG